MSLAGELVDAVFTTLAGVAALTESDRAVAKEAVKAKLAEIEARDKGPVSPRADAIRSRYLIRGSDGIPLEQHLRTPVLPLGFELRDTQPPEDA